MALNGNHSNKIDSLTLVFKEHITVDFLSVKFPIDYSPVDDYITMFTLLVLIAVFFVAGHSQELQEGTRKRSGGKKARDQELAEGAIIGTNGKKSKDQEFAEGAIIGTNGKKSKDQSWESLRENRACMKDCTLSAECNDDKECKMQCKTECYPAELLSKSKKHGKKDKSKSKKSGKERKQKEGLKKKGKGKRRE